jgi:hypothetical protein
MLVIRHGPSLTSKQVSRSRTQEGCPPFYATGMHSIVATRSSSAVCRRCATASAAGSRRLIRSRLGAFSLESTSACASAFAEPLATLESADVTEAQAADVAERMAAAIYEREGLHGVVKRFGYVVLNGARMTERNVDDALAPLERHGQLSKPLPARARAPSIARASLRLRPLRLRLLAGAW